MASTIEWAWAQLRTLQGLLHRLMAGEAGPFMVAGGSADSGQLKRSLRDWLTTVPYVERVVDAEKGDGGAGCTVVWLK
jgi:DNA mismatch repair protein MutS2